MKHVKQKCSRCRRSAMLTVLAILLSSLPFDKALADETAVVDQTDATVTITFTTDGPQGNLASNYMPATITGVSIAVKDGHTLASFTFPTEVPQRDSQKFWSFTKYNISSGTIPTGITEVIVPENVVEIASLPSFPDASSLSLPASLTSMSPSHVLTKIGHYGSTSLTIASANVTYSQEGGILYNNDQTRLLFVHQSLTSGLNTFTIKETVTGLGKDDASSTWDEVFQDKTGITTLEIPATCLLGANTQYESLYLKWPELLNINISGENTDHDTYQYYSVDGVVCKYDDGGDILIYYPQNRTATSYKVPDGIKEVRPYGFYKSQFTSIELNQVEKLSANSFFRCTNKIELTIGESLANIPPNSFAETKIKAYSVVEENQYYASDAAGVLFNKGMTKLMEYPQGANDNEGTYVVPATVTEIGEKAFSNCKNFKGSITFAGTGLTTIGKNAFDQCGLTSIDLSQQNGITDIPERCFSQSGLTSIVPPTNLATIGEYAFHNTKLSGTLTLPDGVTSIGKDAFSYCTLLTGVGFPETLTEIGENAFGSCSNLNENNTTLPKTVTTLGARAFSNCGFRAVTIPSVENYGGGAFNNNANLVSITILSGMTKIPDREFQNCGQLETINLPNSITEIGRGAFACTGLTSLTIPASVTKIGYNACGNSNTGNHGTTGAFEGCTQLTEIIFEDRSEATGSLMIYDNTFKGCTGLTEVTIPAKVGRIGCYAFYGCTALASVTITDVTQIWHRAFAGCTSLSTLVLPETLTTIKHGAFARCNSLTTVNLPASLTTMEASAFLNCRSLATVNVAGNSKLKSIPNYAFCWADDESVEEYDYNQHTITENTALTQFNFSGSTHALQNIYTSAFNSCINLTSFECPSKLTTIYASAFYGCKSLSSLTFANNCLLKTIKKNAFLNCMQLNKIDFPSKLETIDESAFQNCRNLEKITFEGNEKLKEINQCAFKECVKLKNFTIPESLENIGYQAFTDCISLTEVNFPAMIKKIDGQAFEFCPNIAEFNVAELDLSDLDPDDEEYEEKVQARRDLCTYSSVGGYLMLKDKTTLVGFPEAKANDRFTLLPPSITAIGDYAFFNCQSLKNVVIPNKVTSIGIRSFGQCTNLKTITFLCDEMILPENINQLKNQNSFDDKVNDGDEFKDNGFAGMTFYVRKHLQQAYSENQFYCPNVNAPTIISSFDDGENEFINVSENVVDFLSTTSQDHTFVLPETVIHNGEPMSVELIGDYAFENASEEIKEVVVFNNVSYVGGNAFVTQLADAKQGRTENESTIRRIFFVTNAPDNGTPGEDATALERLKKEQLSTTRFKLTAEHTTGDRDYSEFTPAQQIFVKKSMCDGYKASWPLYADRIDYRISPMAASARQDASQSAPQNAPQMRAGGISADDKADFIAIAKGKKYGTFSREFDVDLGVYAQEVDESFDMRAFATGTVAKGPGSRKDFPEDNDGYNAPYHLRMQHIGEKGTYIPHSTGVVLAVMNGWNGTPDGFFYCIGEGDNGGERGGIANQNENGALQAVLRNDEVLQAIDADATPTQWVMQSGVFKYVRNTPATVPAHKAWLYLDNSAKPASVMAMKAFYVSLADGVDDDPAATAIEALDARQDKPLDGDIYTLTGAKVAKPTTRGVYIVNGKKVLIK